MVGDGLGAEKQFLGDRVDAGPGGQQPKDLEFARRQARQGIFGLERRRFLVDERGTLMDNDVRLLHSGRRARLAPDVLALLDETIALTAGNGGMQLSLAISYGGRQELVDGVQALARRVQAGELSPDAIDESAIQASLYQPTLPDPDILIRTAGELRISNFLLWQVSYAEIHVSDVCWPEFGKDQLHEAFREYGRRVRKFGKVL